MEEVNADREDHRKKPFDDDDEPPAPTKKRKDNTSKKKLSRRKKWKKAYRNPKHNRSRQRLFVKGDHKRQFAYEDHTARDKHDFVLETIVTPGNVHDSVAFDEVYDRVICPEYQALAYRTTNRDGYREYRSNPNICVICPTRHLCTHSKDCVKTVQRHIWRDYEDLADDARYTPKTRLMLKA